MLQFFCSVALLSGDPQVLLKEGISLYQQGQYREALRRLEEVARLSEGKANAHALREDALFYIAKSAFALHRDNQASQQALILLDQYAGTKYFAEAIQLLYEVGVRKIDTPAKFLLWDVTRADEGLAILEKLLKFDPNGPLADDTLYKMARTHYERGEFDVAREQARQIVDRFPRSEFREPAMLLVALCAEKGSRGASYDVSGVRTGMGDAVRAAADAKDPRTREQALAYRKSFENTLAESEYRKAIALLKYGDVQSAVAVFRLVKEQHPGTPYAAIARRALDLPELKELAQEYGEQR